jgi:RNA polymerase sigma factor (sigma-70 family)
MTPRFLPDRGSDQGVSLFRTTLWTEVLQAADGSSPESEAALARLCQTYWGPVYAFIRKKGHSREEAEDLVQGFFARFLEKNFVSRANRNRGRFRSFLMTSVQHYLHDAHDRATRAKRGGACKLISLDASLVEKECADLLRDSDDPAVTFERRWASAILDQVMKRLASEHQESGRRKVFEELQPHLWGESEAAPYSELSARLGLSAVNLRVLGHRMRQRFRELLREEIAQTVSEPSEIETELQYLMRVIAR